MMNTRKSSKISPRRASVTVPDDTVETIKLMCRVLEFTRRKLVAEGWKRLPGNLSLAQFDRLMTIRHLLPCNLGEIMTAIGLTSAGASLFVERLVRQGILERVQDPEDRRNIRISATPQVQQLLNEVDELLSKRITEYLSSVPAEQVAGIGDATRTICEHLLQDFREG